MDRLVGKKIMGSVRVLGDSVRLRLNKGTKELNDRVKSFSVIPKHIRTSPGTSTRTLLRKATRQSVEVEGISVRQYRRRCPLGAFCLRRGGGHFSTPTHPGGRKGS